MQIRLVGKLTTTQKLAIVRAKSYRGRQPHKECFANCIIFYDHDLATILPLKAPAASYYWATGFNNMSTSIDYTPPVVFGSLGSVNQTVFQPNFPETNSTGLRVASASAGQSVLSYSMWLDDQTQPQILIFYTPSSITHPDPDAAFTNTRDPSVRWHWLNGTCTINDADASVVSSTLTWTPAYPSYELLISPEWNAMHLAKHVAYIDWIKNAVPPTVSPSPATSVTVSVTGASAPAYVKVSANPTGFSTATRAIDSDDIILNIASVPLTLVLTPDVSDATDTVVLVEFYRNGVLFASEDTEPFTHELVISVAGTSSYSAIYTDASDNQDYAPLDLPVFSSKVEFYKGGTLVQTSTAPPYTYRASNLLEGSYTYSALVYDDLGVSSAGTITVSAVGPCCDVLDASLEVNGRPVDATHAYARPYFTGKFYKPGTVGYWFPLNPLASGQPLGIFADARQPSPVTDYRIEGFARIQCGDATDSLVPHTVLGWVDVAWTTRSSTEIYANHVGYVNDAKTFGAYPVSGWWYDEVEQLQKEDMAKAISPTTEIALFKAVYEAMLS